MLIEKFSPGRGKPDRYFIKNNDGTTLTRFDNLEDAALVLRYINGGNMGDQERQAAVSAMQKAATPGDETKGNR